MAAVSQVNPVSVLDNSLAFQGLTARQQLFVSLRFSGLTCAESYRQSGDCSNMSEDTLGKRANEMDKLPRVQGKMRELQSRRDSQAMLAADLNRDWITKRIMYLADSTAKDSVKLASLVALGKVVGIDLFRETTRVERVERTAEDIDKELETQLRSIATTLEGKARDVTPRLAPAASRKRARLKPGS